MLQIDKIENQIKMSALLPNVKSNYTRAAFVLAYFMIIFINLGHEYGNLNDIYEFPVLFACHLMFDGRLGPFFLYNLLRTFISR